MRSQFAGGTRGPFPRAQDVPRAAEYGWASGVVLGMLMAWAPRRLARRASGNPQRGSAGALNAALITRVGVPALVVTLVPAVFLPVALALRFLLRDAVFGRVLNPVGTNGVAARFAAINIRRVRIWVCTLRGVLVGC